MALCYECWRRRALTLPRYLACHRALHGTGAFARLMSFALISSGLPLRSAALFRMSCASVSSPAASLDACRAVEASLVVSNGGHGRARVRA